MNYRNIRNYSLKVREWKITLREISQTFSVARSVAADIETLARGDSLQVDIQIAKDMEAIGYNVVPVDASTVAISI